MNKDIEMKDIIFANIEYYFKLMEHYFVLVWRTNKPIFS